MKSKPKCPRCNRYSMMIYVQPDTKYCGSCENKLAKIDHYLKTRKRYLKQLNGAGIR